ncbi:Hypothetical predicted protein, partial [Paramuricea clavata]
EHENENTRRKTFYDTKVFLEFLAAEGERRKIEEIHPNELERGCQRFVLSVRKKSGEEYEPSSIREWLSSISIKRQGVQDILKKKQKLLKSLGKGNKPNSNGPLTDEEIEQLYSEGVLGNGTPRSLLNTVWLNNCIFLECGLGRKRDLCWGDLELKVDAEGVSYVQFATERQMKTGTGENPRDVRETKPKMSENPDNTERCPITAFLYYQEHRPAQMLNDDSPFYTWP